LKKTPSGYQFAIRSHDLTFASGQGQITTGRPARLKLKEIQARCPMEKRDAPKNVRQRGHFDFGPHWQSLRQIAFGKTECLGLMELPFEYKDETNQFALHPALMDIATGVAMYLLPGYDKPGDVLLPFAYKRLAVYATLPPRIYSHARMHPDSGGDLVLFDVTLANEQGDVIAEIEDFTIKRMRSVADLAELESEAAQIAAPLDEASDLPGGIPTREGLEAFRRLLRSGSAEVTYVSPVQLSPAAPMKESELIADPAAGSADDIEEVLAQLWQRLLGLDEVDAKTDFFDSGGHSLLAVRLFTEIRKRFNINFGLSTLFEARTVGALADLIRKARAADSAQKSPGAAHALVAIRPRGTTTPLFLIHDVGGSVLRYEHLARHFPENQAIFAIESRGLSGLPTDFAVEDMARHYIQQIRERQPQGPYYVAGHSFGGLITYEIARQLSAAGETMGLVGLLDTFQRAVTEEDNLGPTQPAFTGKLPIFQRLTTDAKAIILGRDRIGYLQERKTYIQAWAVKTTYRTAHKISTRFGLGMPGFLNDVKEANWIASDYFTPKPYDGEVVLFRCQHRLPTDPPDSSHIWRRLVKEVVIIDVPGDHNSMLREPMVQVLAGQILTYLEPASPAANPAASEPDAEPIAR
jgi:thioesterase domain-containing protein/acyl carrier protein